MFDYDKNAKKAAQVLDRYDFSEALKECCVVAMSEIIGRLEKYGKEVSAALNQLSADEVATYLNLRYGMHVQEIYEYYMSWNPRYETNTE